MLEVRLVQGALLKKVLEAIRELVADANFDFSPSGLSLQAMDSTHVAVAALLRADAFYHFRCDRNRSVGMNLGYVTKLLRCAANDDILTLKAGDDADTVTFMFESPSVRPVEFRTGQEELGWAAAQARALEEERSPIYLVNC